MAKKEENCPKCGALYTWDLGLPHNEDLCLGRQLLQARKEIKTLKASVDGWKDAWFHLREIIGNLWWYHPAIDSDERRAYYQGVLKAQRMKDCVDHSCAECDDCEAYLDDLGSGVEHRCTNPNNQGTNAAR